MKKFLFSLLMLGILYTGYSQSQRLVFFEEFTNASCGPCASQNPAFDALLNANSTKCTSVKYHTNWPGVDPMNAQNPTDVGARVTYYSVNGVPYALMDGSPQTGSSYLGAPANVTQAKIDNRYAVPSPLEMQMQYTISTGQDSVYSTMLIKCTQNVTGSLVAHNIVIEKHIHFNSPPGSNGEKDFYNVMKKMLPGPTGTTIPSSMVPGDYVLLEGSWKFAAVYDKTQISTVGFVQDKSTKTVHQSAVGSTNVIVMPYNNDLQVLDIKNVPARTCKNKITPMVQIRNNGNNTITSMTIQYKVNDESVNTYIWNGSLPLFQKVMVTLPEIQYSILPSNILTIYTVSPNSVSDEYPKNDTLNYAFQASPVSTQEVSLILRTNNAPEEITWDVKNSLGTVIDQAGPYSLPSHTYYDTIQLPQADCYTFTIYDAGGNGICCSNGTGVYEISSGGTIIKQGGQFGSLESSEFWLEAPTAVQEPVHSTGVTVFPNPFDASARVTFYLANPAQVTLTLFSAIGEKIQTRSLGMLSSGSHETVVEGDGLKSGIYILQLNTGIKIESRKVTIIH